MHEKYKIQTRVGAKQVQQMQTKTMRQLYNDKIGQSIQQWHRIQRPPVSRMSLQQRRALEVRVLTPEVRQWLQRMRHTRPSGTNDTPNPTTQSKDRSRNVQASCPWSLFDNTAPMSRPMEKCRIAGKAQSLMFSLANTSDPHRHVAETRQGWAVGGPDTHGDKQTNEIHRIKHTQADTPRNRHTNAYQERQTLKNKASIYHMTSSALLSKCKHLTTRKL